MPARSLTAIAHSALTDHRIPARAGEPFPAESSQPSNRALPELIQLTAVPGEDSPVPPVTLLQAYSDVSQQYPDYKPRYRQLLAELAATDQSNPIVLGMRARDVLERAQENLLKAQAAEIQQAMRAAQQEAIDDLERAIRLGSTSLPDYNLLGDLLARMGRFQDAIAVLDRGLALEPYVPEFYPLLSDCYAAIGKTADSVEALRSGLRLFPGDEAMRRLLREKGAAGAPSGPADDHHREP
jgi:tetratricopeptide (TPR) repeat protein